MGGEECGPMKGQGADLARSGTCLILEEVRTTTNSEGNVHTSQKNNWSLSCFLPVPYNKGGAEEAVT